MATRLTLGKVRAFTKRALKDAGSNAPILKIEWIGQRSEVTRRLGRCEYKEYFRVARVVLQANDGRSVYKYATLDSNNGFSIR